MKTCIATPRDQSVSDYTFAKWQMAILALALVIVLAAVWYGIRRILLSPLSSVIRHIREIAGGNLTHTLTIAGRSEMTELAQSVDHMQHALIETVTNVRRGVRCDLCRHQRNCRR